MGQEKAWIDLQSFARLRPRFIEPVRGRISPRQIRIDDDRERIELGCAFPFRDRLVEMAKRQVAEPEPVMRGGVVRLQLDRALEVRNRAFETEIERVQQTERGM